MAGTVTGPTEPQRCEIWDVRFSKTPSLAHISYPTFNICLKRMKTKPLIIPIFIPQEGCRHRCVYCDQPTISGASQASWSPSSIRQHVKNYLDNCNRYPVQVAFYGGSFTLLPEARQRFFLESVQEFLKQGLVHSLRLSTRPDAVETKNLCLLQSMGVKTIELGAQSLSDSVLKAAARGHTSRDVCKATLKLQQYGFETGLQLMPGLPKDSRATFLRTVDKSVALHPSFVRLYPTVVLSSTPLAHLYRRGRYRPLSLEQAVTWCKEAKQRFASAGIPIIRIGLQPTVTLEQPGHIVAGPYHPAFGQLVLSSLWRDRISPVLKKASLQSQRLLIHAAPHQLADIRGHRNGNIKKWLAELNLTSLETLGCSQIEVGEFRVTAHSAALSKRV
jgi:histone acetyltransferase (RNA polymerase elongator complex component)